MDEMTSREIELYLKRGGDLAFVPFGPISGHGALIPVGMHGHWAQALSLLLADRADGLVFPVTWCCFAGATRTFRGTVSFPIDEQVKVLSRIANSLYEAGFRRTVLVGGTTPEALGGEVAARDLFDRTERPFWFVEAARLLDAPEVKAIYEGYPGSFGETLLELASLRILGRERETPHAEWAREIKSSEGGDQPAEIFADVVALRRAGAMGFRYHEEAHHGNHGTAGIEYEGRLDIDMAEEVLHKCAEVLAPSLSGLTRYADWLEAHPFKYIVAVDRLDEQDE
jgi:creatinine amidohydrolase/Fe(II)-dependent formamide hydrolase-like protein